MMQALRDNMKLIIWITAVVFLVGFGILELGGVLDSGGQQRSASGVIGKINGEPVRYEEFQRVYTQMTQQLDHPMQEGEDSYIREQAWQQLVRAKLMDQEARRRGIEVTPDEIKAAIRLTPPEFLMQAPVFQTDGQFDYRKYLAELENPNSQLPWGQVEAVVASQLPTQKLQDEVVAAAKASEGDVRDRFLLQNETLKLHGLAFRADSFTVDTTRIGGPDIESYYKSHPEEFTGPEQVKIQVILVPRSPSETDFSAAKERLQGILDQIRAMPDSFEMYARTYSEISSAAGGGKVPGERPIDIMRPAFRDALRKLKVGDISPILREERSLHIFRVDNLRPDPATGQTLIQYHEIAIRVQPGPEAIRASREQVTSLTKDAKGQGLAPIATKRGYRTFESGYFAQGQSGNSVFERFPEAELWCFTARKGSVSRPVPTENGWYLYQVLDRRPAGVRPLEAVEREGKLSLIRSLRLARAEEAAEKARAAILSGTTPEEAARAFNGIVVTEPTVTRNGIMGQFGQDPVVVGRLLTLPVKTWTPVLKTPQVAFTAFIEEHNVPSEELFQQQAPQIRQSLLNERRQVIFFEWMQDVRRKAKIEDYRENYFEA